MTPEFSVPLPLARIARGGATVTITADAAERAALARRMNIPAVHELSCAFTLTRSETNPARIVAEGVLLARVTRECIVTAEDFETPVEDHFRIVFVPAGEESEELQPDQDDEIPYQNEVLDLGEAAAEQLALGLDPYPRIEGAEMPDIAADDDANPFAALARLKGAKRH